MDNRKQYLDENGVLYYTQRIKAVLDDLLAAKANGTDLTAETTARTAADNTLQGNIDVINNTKIINITGSGNTIPATELAKLPNYGVVLLSLEQTQDTDARTMVGITCNFGMDTFLILFTGDGTLMGRIVAGQALDLQNGVMYYASPEADTLDGLVNMLNDYDDNLIAKTEDLNNLSNNTYRKTETFTKAEVNAAIAAAIAGVTQIRFEIVQTLPQTGENGVIYLVQYAQTPQGNIYQEWIWIESLSTYETLGSTNQIDLTNYVTFDDLQAITNTEIEDIVNDVFDIEPEPEPTPQN